MNSNFLTGLSNVAGAAADIGSIASGFGAVTGVAKGVGNLLGLGGNQQKQQYKYQKKLMEYQNQLNQQNSLLDYQRQRELTADNPMLQKIGLRNAGMNTAMGDGSTASAASVGSTSPSSTPSPLPTDAQVDSQYASMISQLSSSLQSSQIASADIRVKNAQAKNQEIQNAFEIDKQIEQLDGLHKANKISDVEYDTRMENLLRLRDTHNSYVKQEDEKANQSELDTKIKDIQSQQEQARLSILEVTKSLTDEQLKQAQFVTEHQLERFTKEMQEIFSRISSNKASAAASYAAAAKSRSDALYTDVLRRLESAKIPHADQLATYVTASAMHAAQLADYNQQRAKFDLDIDKQYHSSNSTSWEVGEWFRNALSGWLPFSAGANISKTIK